MPTDFAIVDINELEVCYLPPPVDFIAEEGYGIDAVGVVGKEVALKLIFDKRVVDAMNVHRHIVFIKLLEEDDVVFQDQSEPSVSAEFPVVRKFFLNRFCNLAVKRQGFIASQTGFGWGEPDKAVVSFDGFFYCRKEPDKIGMQVV